MIEDPKKQEKKHEQKQEGKSHQYFSKPEVQEIIKESLIELLNATKTSQTSTIIPIKQGVVTSTEQSELDRDEDEVRLESSIVKSQPSLGVANKDLFSRQDSGV